MIKFIDLWWKYFPQELKLLLDYYCHFDTLLRRAGSGKIISAPIPVIFPSHSLILPVQWTGTDVGLNLVNDFIQQNANPSSDLWHPAHTNKWLDSQNQMIHPIHPNRKYARKIILSFHFEKFVPKLTTNNRVVLFLDLFNISFNLLF